MRNWLLGRTSFDVSGNDVLRVTYGHHLDDALARLPHTVPFDGVGTSDTFPGSPGNDHLVGTNGDDDFDLSQGGDDTVTGKGGNDTFKFGTTFTGADQVFGRNGFDSVNLVGDYSAGLSLAAGTLRGVEDITFDGMAIGGGSAWITLDDGNVAAGASLGVTGLQSSSGTLSFHFDGSAETDGDLFLSTFGRGNDILIGGAGNDSINAGVSGTDVLDGGGGWNRASFSRAITGASGGVTVSLSLQGVAQDVGGGRMVTLSNFQGLLGSTRNDTFIGDTHANALVGGGGSDSLSGMDGDDVITVQAGAAAYATTAAGGLGNDTLTFATSPNAAVTFSLLLQGTAQAVSGGTVTADGFENLSGATLNDTLTGDAQQNRLYGQFGDDLLIGGQGDDSLFGDMSYGFILDAAGQPIDFGSTVFGVAQDTLQGGDGNDLLDGGDGDDVLQGGKDDDTLNGGNGIDTGDYSDATGGVTVDLGILTAQAVGGGLGSDTLSSVEALLGSNSADSLTGDSSANTLDGAGGDDGLNGAGGADLLQGGAGADTLHGDEGNDRLYGGDDNDVLQGAGGKDWLFGGSGDDDLGGGRDADMLVGADGNDALDGQGGADRLLGDAGADTLKGSQGGDVLVGDESKLVATSFACVSTSGGGATGTGSSFLAKFSADDSKITFSSFAANLISGDTNGFCDVFVKDLVTGTVVRVSVGPGGVQGNADAAQSSFSPDGTSVVFDSFASTFVSEATNPDDDVFVADLTTGAVTLVSRNAAGIEGDGVSLDAEFLAGGTKVLFTSYTSNLIAGDTNNVSDIFMKDLVSGAVTCVSTDASGNLGNSWSQEAVASADGTKVLFASESTNLVAGDTNGFKDFFVKDLLTGEVTLVSTASDGTQGTENVGFTAAISDDGTKVLFTGDANLGNTGIGGQLYLKDLNTGELTTVSQTASGEFGNLGSNYSFAFSPDGRYVVFTSDASNLVADDENGVSDVFFKDLVTGTVSRLTLPDGTELDQGAEFMDFSSDGRSVLITSTSTNLPNANGSKQVFLVDLDFLSAPAEDDALNGGSGNDVLAGGAGADRMNGGSGSDAFVYYGASDSTSIGYDTVIKCDFASDVFDMTNTVSGVDAAIVGGALANSTFDSDLEAAVNSAALGAGHAVLFTPDAGNHAGQTFLLVDGNNNAGYQAGEDFVIRLQGAVNMASFDTGNFI